MTNATGDQRTIAVPRHRLLRVMNRIPYSGGIQTAHVDFDGDAVIAWLEQLADRLDAAGTRARDRSAELEELRTQRDAVRAFLGIEGSES